MEAAGLSCRFSWIWYCSLKYQVDNIWKVLSDCSDFLLSYLHLIRYPLKLQKFAILTDIVRQRLSANQIVMF